MAFFRLIRFQNLLIVALTQVLLYYKILLPAYQVNAISPRLDGQHFLMFVAVTLIITACGYIINDIYDLPSDLINRPKRVLVQQQISLQVATWLYATFGIWGFLIALYLAFYVQMLPLINLYWVAFLFLFWYTQRLKKEPLLGNVLVALMCAGVAAAVWLAEAPKIKALYDASPTDANFVWNTFLWYFLFAFFSTLFREIVKDLEDQTGDRKTGARTLPILFGVKTAKITAVIAGSALLALLVWQKIWVPQQFQGYFYLLELIFVVLPMLFSFFLLYRAEQPKAYRRVSLLAKIIMLNGILLLFLAHG
jgi:4-hydroxybenzoate polyprenyltransferase